MKNSIKLKKNRNKKNTRNKGDNAAMFILGMGIFSAIVPTIVAIVFEKWEAAIIWGIVAFFLGVWGVVFMYALQKEMNRFISDLCKLLDQIIYGEKELELNLRDHSLLDRVSFRLERFDNIIQKRRSKLETEKKELQRIISDISHQTKTPIANLKVINDTLLTRKMSKDKMKDFLESSGRQLDKLDFLIKALVEMSQLESGIIVLEKKDVLIIETLACAINEIQYKMDKKHINLCVNCEENLSILHDKKWTSEVFFNLLDNAVKYTSSYGTICIDVNDRELYMEIAITDTGRGIPEAEQGAIFKRFYREKEVHDIEGVGIGLYLSRQIITMQGGYIRVVSEINKGSTFSIFLPKN